MPSKPRRTAHVRSQPLIAVRDVAASSRWYQALLGCESGHGGDEYEMLVNNGELVLQLHAWDLDEHANLMGADAAPHGHGVLLWFETTDFDASVEAAQALKVDWVEEPHVNPNSRRWELWVRDPDGYVVVVSAESRARRS
ncbi:MULTISPECIES: VOC family protein [Corallococcus]|uniref:VOC family protein n=1 Tax=Corallococcus TaxID=83461 RepID=UPI00117D5C47|nr:MULTISPECIES: VOC family protein [Corallococcus]NBD10415.1 VOC family protein [Corallococcus silvisoli]TSC27629.1 VOC family protein [Corallococcus sp. Z5C101001]